MLTRILHRCRFEEGGGKAPSRDRRTVPVVQLLCFCARAPSRVANRAFPAGLYTPDGFACGANAPRVDQGTSADPGSCGRERRLDEFTTVPGSGLCQLSLVIVSGVRITAAVTDNIRFDYGSEVVGVPCFCLYRFQFIADRARNPFYTNDEFKYKN